MGGQDRVVKSFVISHKCELGMRQLCSILSTEHVNMLELLQCAINKGQVPEHIEGATACSNPVSDKSSKKLLEGAMHTDVHLTPY